MTLHAIVAALGGDLYQGGHRANVPAPGHSASDRSVSLLLSGGRVIIHGFGAAGWRAVRDDLRNAGFVDAAGRLTGAGRAAPSAPAPDRRVRVDTAARLWAGAVPLDGRDAASLYLRRRAITGAATPLELGFHPCAPVAVYRREGRTRPALIARILDAQARLSAVELTYLEPNGLRATDLALSRKTVGVMPPGAAVRLAPAAADLLVGEGVITTLSAMDRFKRPGWALMAANNLAGWTPPPQVRRLLIAADRGRVGQDAAARLRRRLLGPGLEVAVLWPAAPFDDWNAVARDQMKRRE
jgi:hypothetical protein